MTNMILAATIASILLLTALAWLARRAAWPRLCPLCAGVAGTWAWLLAAHATGAEVDLRLPALLLGGSVVGLAGQAETLKGRAGETRRLAWKTGVAAAGFATAYWLLVPAWAGFAVGLVLLAGLLLAPWLTAPAGNGTAKRRKKLLAQLKDCC